MSKTYLKISIFSLTVLIGGVGGNDQESRTCSEGLPEGVTRSLDPLDIFFSLVSY